MDCSYAGVLLQRDIVRMYIAIAAVETKRGCLSKRLPELPRLLQVDRTCDYLLPEAITTSIFQSGEGAEDALHQPLHRVPTVSFSPHDVWDGH